MFSVAQIRRMFKDCDGHSDEEVLRAYHAKFYGDTDYGEFQKQYEDWQKARAERESIGGRKSAGGGSGGKQKGFDPEVQAMDLAGIGQDPKTGNFWFYQKDKNGDYLLDEKGQRMLDYRKPPSRHDLQLVRDKLARSGIEGFDPADPYGFKQEQNQQAPAANQGSQPGGNQQPAQASQEPQQGGMQAAVATAAPVIANPTSQPTAQPVIVEPSPSVPVDIGAYSINDTVGDVSDGLRYFGVDAARGMRLLGEGVGGAINWVRGNPGAADEEMADYTINTERKW